VIDGKFLVAGSMASRKGQELKAQPKAALTFWWDALERQVRIQGDVAFADEALAQALFLARSRDSQIVSSICRQGAVIENPSELENQFETISNAASAPAIEVPPGWGAILIAPKRIEFMTFRKSRLHERKLYEKGDNWVESYLAP
jgi:pyridoxamine 5'-phosphate oxidase